MSRTTLFELPQDGRLTWPSWTAAETTPISFPRAKNFGVTRSEAMISKEPRQEFLVDVR